MFRFTFKFRFPPLLDNVKGADHRKLALPVTNLAGAGELLVSLDGPFCPLHSSPLPLLVWWSAPQISPSIIAPAWPHRSLGLSFFVTAQVPPSQQKSSREEAR